MNDTPAFTMTPGLSGLIHQLSHLSQFGADALVVEGARGSGRSSLLSQVREHLSTHQTLETPITLVSVSANSDADVGETSVIDRLASELGIHRNQNSFGEQITKLRSFSEALMRDKQLAIGFVDDASQLDEQSLGAMLSLLQHDLGQGYGLKLMFFADSGFARRVDDIGIVDIVVYDFQIPPFGVNEIAELVAARFPEYEQWVQDAKVPNANTLWQHSGGLPGSAITLVREAIADNQDDEHSGMWPSIFKMPVLHLVLVSALLAGLLVSFLYRSGDEAEVSNTSIAVSPPSDLAEPSTSVSSSALNRQNPSERSHSASAPQSDGQKLGEGDLAKVADKEVYTSKNTSNDNSEFADEGLDGPPERAYSESERASLGPAVFADGKEHAADKERLADKEPVAIAEIDLDPRDTRASADAVSANLDGSSTDVNSATSIGAKVSNADKVSLLPDQQNKPKPRVDNFSASELGLLQVDDTTFFLQLLAATKKDGLEDFIRRQSNRDSLILYRKKRAPNQTWFVVVLGPYANRDAAQQAFASLPEAQRKSTPWVRSARAIKNEIHSYHKP